MLALTKKAGYGLIAMTHLAKMDGEEYVSAREIAEKFGVPRALLMNVMKELSAAGYVESARGLHGGYRLAREPEDISLAELVAAVEGPMRIAECVTDAASGDTECTCEVMARCPISDPIHRLHRRLNDFLKKISLAEIVEPSLATESGTGL